MSYIIYFRILWSKYFPNVFVASICSSLKWRPILYLANVHFTLPQFHPERKHTLFIVYSADWAPDPVRTILEKEFFLFSVEISKTIFCSSIT